MHGRVYAVLTVLQYMHDVLMLQQQQVVAIDNSRTLITNLLRHMALLSSSSSSSSSSSAAAAAAVDMMRASDNDAGMSSQSASSSSSTSSERHMTSSTDSGVVLHCPSMSVINDVMSVTSDDNHVALVSALVAFVKVCLFLIDRVHVSCPTRHKHGRFKHTLLS